MKVVKIGDVKVAAIFGMLKADGDFEDHYDFDLVGTPYWTVFQDGPEEGPEVDAAATGFWNKEAMYAFEVQPVTNFWEALFCSPGDVNFSCATLISNGILQALDVEELINVLDGIEVFTSFRNGQAEIAGSIFDN